MSNTALAHNVVSLDDFRRARSAPRSAPAKPLAPAAPAMWIVWVPVWIW